MPGQSISFSTTSAALLRYFHVDAFAQTPFAGNPAGVCPLETPLPAALRQQIAAENSRAQTAFFVPRASEPAEFDLRSNF